MGLNLKSFRHVTNGFARHHHFNMGIVDWRDPAFSSKLLGTLAGAAATPIVSAFASSMQIPTKRIETEKVPIHHGVPGMSIGNGVTYDDWTVTFYADELLLLRFFFLRWMELINNTDDHTFSLPNRYKSSLAYASILSPTDIPVQVFTFKGLYPKEVGGIVMDGTFSVSIVVKLKLLNLM
jgi:hypothetical protein